MQSAPATNYAKRAVFDPSSAHRRSMLAKVQIARKELAMEEDDYRQIVFDKTGRTSLKEASERDLIAVLDVMKAKGFRPLGKASPAPAAQHPSARKARALWISLFHLGAVHNPSEQALEAFAKKQLGCDKLVWAKQSDMFRLIEALKSMAKRAGWPQYHRATGARLTPLQLQETLCGAILGKLRRAEAVPAEWMLNQAAERLCGIEFDGPWTIESYTAVAAALGKKLRELAPGQLEALS